MPRGAVSTLAANLAAPDPRLPAQVRLFLDRRMHAAVRAELESFRPDVLHIVLARMAPYSQTAPPGVHVHLDFVDALSLNMASRAGRLALPGFGGIRARGAADGSLRGRAARAAATASVVSERDRLASPGLASAVVIPNGVAVDELAYEEPADRPPRGPVLRESRVFPQRRAGPACGARGASPAAPGRAGRVAPHRGRPPGGAA